MGKASSLNILRWGGIAITALAVGLVGWSVYTSELLASGSWKSPEVLTAVLISAAIFVPSLICVATAWYLLIASVSKIRISWLECYSIYAISDLYRYIPSNIVHYVGRYYMLHRRGVAHSVAAWGILAEMALYLSASALVVVSFGAPLVREAVLSAANESWLLQALPILSGLALTGVALLTIKHRDMVRNLVEPFLRAKVFHSGLAAFALHVAARIISGSALWFLSSRLLQSAAPPFPDVVAIWAAAWLLGYIVPGASAGLGVREAVMIASFSGLGVPLAGATLVAIAFRATTTISDLIFSGSGWLSRRMIITTVT